MKLSDAISQFLVSRGITVVFGYQGGSITHMIDSFEHYGIEYIQNYNEQASGLAADAYSRIKLDGIGVAIASNGPGVTNLITGISNAYCDSVPVLYITGQVHTYAMKKNANVRQESFQEIDILSIVKPITKYAVTIMNKDDALEEISKAMRIAKDGRPGPVLVDLPVDIQGMDIEYIEPEEIISEESYNIDGQVDEVIQLLIAAKRPLIIAGGGVRASGGVNEFRKIVDRLGIPVVVSLMGLDVIPHDDPNFVGFLGCYGNRYANIAIQSADVILVLGSRLDMRQTGKRKDLFAKSAKIIHVDVDCGEICHYIPEYLSINCSLDYFMLKFEKVLPNNNLQGISEWKFYIKSLKEKYPDTRELEQINSLNPNVVLKQIANLILQDSIVCADVGQNQMWLAQSLRIKGEKCRILNSGGLGTMGYSLPAAIGAYYARPDSKIYAFMGDGGFQMNMQELQVISSRQLPITIVVLNNHALGLIRDVHEKFYDNRYIGSVEGFAMPDLMQIAKAYKLRYAKITRSREIKGIETILNDQYPCIIEVEFTENTYVYPELSGNDGLEHQLPYKE